MIRTMQVDWPHYAVMADRVMLGEVIGQVALAFGPVDVEVTLSFAIADPVIAHVHCLGSTLLDEIVGNAISGAVVSLQRNRMLLPPEFFKLNANRFGVDAVVEDTSDLGFGRRRDDFFHDVRLHEKGTVDGRCWVVGSWGLVGVGKLRAEEEESTSARSRLGFGEIGSIAVNPQLHVTGGESENGIGMRCCVVQKVNELVQQSLGSVGSRCRKRVERHHHGVVQRACVI